MCHTVSPFCVKVVNGAMFGDVSFGLTKNKPNPSSRAVGQTGWMNLRMTRRCHSQRLLKLPSTASKFVAALFKQSVYEQRGKASHRWDLITSQQRSANEAPMKKLELRVQEQDGCRKSVQGQMLLFWCMSQQWWTQAPAASGGGPARRKSWCIHGETQVKIFHTNLKQLA